MRRGAVLLLAASLGAAPLSAHDFWIEPSSFRPQVAETVTARLWVGPHLRGEAFPRFSKLIVSFALFSDAGQTPLSGRDGDDPAGAVRIETPGLQVIGYRSRDYPVSIDAAKFEEYLREEGLETISQTRARRGETQKPAREVFSRAAKALLDAGAPEAKAAKGFDRNLGFTLELLPEKNPYAAKPGDTLSFRLLYEGKPLPGALVQALSKEQPETNVSARASRQGKVSLKLDAPGFWLVKAVHMVPAPSGVDADWQSLWASLTFEIGPSNPVGKAP
ncbi:MAG: DUF4198 domain-containing protein [Thermoanaerobaculia bacterium]